MLPIKTKTEIKHNMLVNHFEGRSRRVRLLLLHLMVGYRTGDDDVSRMCKLLFCAGRDASLQATTESFNGPARAHLINSIQ